MVITDGVVIEDGLFPMFDLTEGQLAVLKMACGYLNVNNPYLCTALIQMDMSPQGDDVREDIKVVKAKIEKSLGGTRLTLIGYFRTNGVGFIPETDEVRVRFHWVKLLAEYNNL